MVMVSMRNEILHNRELPMNPKLQTLFGELHLITSHHASDKCICICVPSAAKDRVHRKSIVTSLMYIVPCRFPPEMSGRSLSNTRFSNGFKRVLPPYSCTLHSENRSNSKKQHDKTITWQLQVEVTPNLNLLYLLSSSTLVKVGSASAGEAT